MVVSLIKVNQLISPMKVDGLMAKFLHQIHSIGQLKVMVYLEILSRTVNMILEKQVKKLLLLLITKVNLMHIILYQMMQK